MSGVIKLSEANEVNRCGGKAASLAQLIKNGFNVPPGFVVTTLLNLAGREKVMDEYIELGAGKVAVRSSAVAEDGAKDAWAGQLDTFLNVDQAELLDRITACFKSPESDRARAYAKHKNIKSGNVAVIVQTMVPADLSGVAFSAHPITNDQAQIVIESVLGLGDKLVSGTVTPDTYVIEKKTGNLIQKHLAGQVQKLSNENLKNLSKTVIKIEKLFGFPVDVEWAYSDQELFILQSRPITTLG